MSLENGLWLESNNGTILSQIAEINIDLGRNR